MMMQLQDFRFLPDEACYLSPEASQALSTLLETRKSSQNLFEFKLLEKEKVLPEFILRTEKINSALNSIDIQQKDETMHQELTTGLEGLTLQENLIEKRDGFNEEINRKFEIEEEKEISEESNGIKGVLYSLEKTDFDEEKTLLEGINFLEELKGEKLEHEQENVEKAVFNKEVMKKRMINEDEKIDKSKIQQKLSMLSFYNEME